MEVKWEHKVIRLSIDLHLISNLQILTKNTIQMQILDLLFLSNLTEDISKVKS